MLMLEEVWILFVFLNKESLLSSIELFSTMPLYQGNCPH